MKIRFLRGRASNGCSRLCDTLAERGQDVKKLLLSGSTYRGYPSHLVVNWGSSERKSIHSSISILNPPESIENASDKVKAFSILQAEGLVNNIPKWTTSKEEAKRFITQDLEKVYCRTLTRADSGRGIEVAESASEVVSAPLYTAQVESEREIRVHVFKEEVIDFAQKKRMGSEMREERGIDEPDMDVRSHGNGWIFAREGVSIPESAKEVAIAGVKALGLDFGAVDIIITPQGVSKILEINTAPGLEGTTLQRYADAIEALANA